MATKVQTHIIMFGEMHGTEQSPQAVAGFLCKLVNTEIPVRFGIEAEAWQSEALNEALAEPHQFDELFAAAPNMWTIHDGRSSEAILGLLQEIADWRKNGANISVFAFDANLEEWVEAEDQNITRAVAMAKHVDEAAADFTGAVILLSGNIHANKQTINLPGITIEPMATKVTARPVFSLDMKYGPGEAWIQGATNGGEVSIGPMDLSGNADENSIPFAIAFAPTDPSYNAYYFTGTITASPPAFPAAERP